MTDACCNAVQQALNVLAMVLLYLSRRDASKGPLRRIKPRRGRSWAGRGRRV